MLTRTQSERTDILRKATYVDDGTTLFSLNLDLSEFTQCRYYFRPAKHPLFNLLRRGGGCFLDIGANVGYFSLFASKFFKRVLSFECSPLTLRRLRANIDLSDATNVEVFDFGLSDREATAVLYENPLNHGGSTLDAPSGSLNVQQRMFTVQLRLDELPEIQDLSSIDLIKIDVEGHEEMVVKGARGVLEKYRPVLFIETGHNPERFASIRSALPDFYTFANTDGSEVLPSNVGMDIVCIPARERSEARSIEQVPI